MTRKGLITKFDGDLEAQEIDDLDYDYYPNSNKILRISDNASSFCSQSITFNSLVDSDRTVEAHQLVSSGSLVTNNANVTFTAGDCVEMTSGFEVTAGVEFLAQIDDCGTSTDHGFIEGDGGDYLFDENGNMIIDPDKGVTIQYNFLNLPYLVTFGDGRWISWTYDAAGTKLRKERSDGYVQDYVLGIEYSDNVLEAIYHEEGRAVFRDNAFEYQYRIADHLGNTRVMFRNGGSGVAEILNESHFYSYGMEMNGSWNKEITPSHNYLFNGIERETDFDLNVDMATFRAFDNTKVVWWQIDPLSELIPNYSPYHFSFNNPI